MKPIKQYFYIYLMLFSIGCKGFEKIGTHLSTGVDKNTRSIGKNLMDGVGASVTDSLFRERLLSMIDSVVSKTGSSANKTLLALRDSLLSDK